MTGGRATIFDEKTVILPDEIVSILDDRGIHGKDEINRFLMPSEYDLHSPYQLRDMGRAVERIRLALQRKETIALFSDSDLDGLTSITIISKLLRKLDCEKLILRYPCNEEDYGLTTSVVDEFVGAGATLIITLDSGVRDVDEIRYAGSLGIDVIVTDHHEPDLIIPDCIIVNPKLNDCLYPFKNLAGVGVTFKVCHALLMSYVPAIYNRNILLIHYVNESISFAVLCNGVTDCQYRDVSTAEVRQILDMYKIHIAVSYGEGEALLPCIRDCKHYRYINLLQHQESPEAAGIRINRYTTGITSEPSSIDEMITGYLSIQKMSYPKISSFIHDDAASMVAIGTVADVMPLTGENRTLVSLGLASLKSTTHPGLSLIIGDKTPTSRLIGWTLAPLLNTPGRYGKTTLTADFLMGDYQSPAALYDEISLLNMKRKNLVQDHIESIINSPDFQSEGKGVLCVTREIPDGMAGLLASRLSDMSGRPVIVFALPGRNHLVKGSGRSKGQDGFFELVEQYGSWFERIGGHDRAFGFTIHSDRISEFSGLISGMELSPECNPAAMYDCELDLNRITLDFAKCLALLEPYGPGNEEPVFITRNCTIRDFRRMGESGLHGRYTIKENPELQVVGWNMADRMSKFSKGDMISLIYTIDINTFRDVSNPRLVLRDITGQDGFR